MAQDQPSGSRPTFEPLRVGFQTPEIELTSPTSRRPFRRQASWTAPTEQYQQIPTQDDNIADAGIQRQGLGLSAIQGDETSDSKRVPVGSKPMSPGSKPYDTSGTPGLPFGVFSQTTTAQGTPLKYDDSGQKIWPSPLASRLSLPEQDSAYQHVPADVHLLQHQHQHNGPDGCPTRGDVLKSKWSWFTGMIVLLSVFSTVFSAIFVGIALRKPRWGGKIGTQGNLSIENATLLSALFSKLIELTFACVFVATLGQILSRRAFARSRDPTKQGGITIAEINMRAWILQPGTLLTHWTGAWYAMKTVLGVVVLFAALSASFYITAAEALVAPKLSFSGNESRILQGPVSSIYANAKFLALTCETPIQRAAQIYDEDVEGMTCMSIKYAGQGFRNFDTWVAEWAAKKELKLQEVVDHRRPAPYAMMYDNTTVQGQWIRPSGENITLDSKRWGRLVQNITLTMPHPNLIHAVRERQNNILQPEDLKGGGEFYVNAAIPAPSLNVVCVGLNRTELEPMIRINATELPDVYPETVIDEIFGLDSNKTNQNTDQPPWFPHIPMPFNTLAYASSQYGQTFIYILSAPAPSIATDNYVLCGLRSALNPNCTTSYHGAQAGSDLAVHCDYDNYVNPVESLRYNQVEPKAPKGGLWNKDWPPIGLAWAQSVALGQGISDLNASIARIITQMTPAWSPDTDTVLDDYLPSIGEGLAVLAGNTLLLSADHTPFVHMFNYSSERGDYFFDSPRYQNVHATVSSRDYASGYGAPWQGLFYIVLLVVFLLNVFCLAYLLWTFFRDGEVTDYTEPQNLFALAINSPPSQSLFGSCGAGPSGDMLRKRWMVDMSQTGASAQGTPALDTHAHRHTSQGYSSAYSHPHFYIRYPDDDTTTHTNHPSPQIISRSQPQSQTASPDLSRPTGTHHRSYSDQAINQNYFSPSARTAAATSTLPTSQVPAYHYVPHNHQQQQQRKFQIPSFKEFFGSFNIAKKFQQTGGNMHDPYVDESPAVRQYMRLSGIRRAT